MTEPTIEGGRLILRWRRFTLALTETGAYVAEVKVTGDFAKGDDLRIHARRIQRQDHEEWFCGISFEHPNGARIEARFPSKVSPQEALEAALAAILGVLSGPIWCDLDAATSEERAP